MPEAQRLERAEAVLTALSDWLGDEIYLAGARAVPADAAVAPMLASAAASAADTLLRQALRRHPAHGRYASRVLEPLGAGYAQPAAGRG